MLVERVGRGGFVTPDGVAMAVALLEDVAGVGDLLAWDDCGDGTDDVTVFCGPLG